ncbi:hypothetical protein N018_12290 [Pseudomonas syringae CC1557]|uniref:Uncharacterized protein n=1 Tax=Pseudomonas syringae CC1557 TaxID=1357279 RepID=W0N272_PSESX|nr:hypothetical protein N018_12290 [Pseudomonas syringae CC1557]
MSVQVRLDGLAEVALVGVFGAAARSKRKGKATDGDDLDGGMQNELPL